MESPNMKQILRINLVLLITLAAFQNTSAQCNWKSRNIVIQHSDSCKGINFTSNTITAFVTQNGTFTSAYSCDWTVNGTVYPSNFAAIAYNFNNSGLYRFCVKLTDAAYVCDTTYCIDVYMNCNACPNWKSQINYENATVSDSCPRKYIYAAVGMKNQGKYTYLWTSNSDTITNKDTFGHYVPPTNGMFKVCITITDTLTRCDTLICHDLYYNCYTTGIQEEVNEASSMKLHPNPATGKLNFESKNNGSAYKIYDSWGRVLLNESTLAGLNTVDISNLPSGVFYFSLVENNVFYHSVFVHMVE